MVSSQIILGLQTIPSRQINSMLEPAVITVGAIHGGNRMHMNNVAMTGTTAPTTQGMQKDIHQRIARTVPTIAQSAGAKADVRVVELLYNATVNPPALTEKMGPTLRRVAGEGNYGLQPKSTASEDFVLPAEGAGPVLLPGRHAQGHRRGQGRAQPLAALTWMSPA